MTPRGGQRKNDIHYPNPGVWGVKGSRHGVRISLWGYCLTVNNDPVCSGEICNNMWLASKGKSLVCCCKLRVRRQDGFRFVGLFFQRLMLINIYMYVSSLSSPSYHSLIDFGLYFLTVHKTKSLNFFQLQRHPEWMWLSSQLLLTLKKALKPEKFRERVGFMNNN